VAASAGFALAQTTLVANSPFAPAGSAAGAAAAPAQAYELAGSSVQGSTVLVCIYDRQAKHSEWIPVGGVSGPVHVISFDAQHDRAVVTIGGSRKELGLRSAAVVASAPVESLPPQAPAAAPAPVPAPVGPTASSATTASLAHDQNEARMLVSDLLEIGVQQRKAYQEAKQKAAAETPAQPAN
jgi:hypothetical protein